MEWRGLALVFRTCIQNLMSKKHKMGTYLITELSEEEVKGTGKRHNDRKNRTNPDYVIKATQSNSNKRIKNEKNQAG